MRTKSKTTTEQQVFSFDETSKSSACLTVRKANLLDAFKMVIRSPRKVHGVDATLSYKDGEAILALPGVEVTFEADGEWAGQARFSETVLSALIAAPPDGDTLKLSIEGDRLKIGTFGVKCAWTAAPGQPIRLALNSTDVVVLELAYRYSRDEIAQAGLTEKVTEAEEWRDNQIAMAHSYLKELGVTKAQLLSLVDAGMKTRR